MTNHVSYPPGPTAVPADLMTASTTYRRHAWFAVLGLFGFVAAYFGLMIWLGVLAWRHVHDLSMAQSSNPLASVLLIGCSGFLLVFMAKPLFSIQRGHTGNDFEISAHEHPAFFAFLYRLADEAGAPRPKRVFLSSRVNAGVFYDLSILNLIFPSKKNLEIGLALVNVLSLGELKAVLAHEFGHFAQRSMAVGRWVYVAQQIAGHIVAQRGALDRFVATLSRIDLRVAWIGWLLSLVIWSIRSLVDLLFRLVVLSERALSREMEYQADLVATALTGSDALVHALHKLGAADESWQRALAFANDELRAGRLIDDLFTVQSRIIEHLRRVQADPHYGVAPPVLGDPGQHRVFKDSLAKPPAMWSTHPDNADRERNVKRQYVAADIDPRSAWDLFQTADALRQKMTQHMLRDALKEPDKFSTPAMHETLQTLDQQFERPSLDRRYRGSYLNRALTRHAETLDVLFEDLGDGSNGDRSNLLALADSLYDDSHDRDLDRERALRAEAASIQGLIDGELTTGSKTVRWRGEEIRKQDLPKSLAAIQSELDSVRAALQQHDRRCRSVHRAMAETVGEGWARYLEGLLNVLHFAEHSQADLLDTQRILANTYRVVTADNNVSQTELARLIADCNVVQRVLARLDASAHDVVLDEHVLAELKTGNWASQLGTLGLPEASNDNINPWLNAVDGWIRKYSHALSRLQEAVLEVLLASEQRILEAYRRGEQLEAAPKPSQPPARYACLLPGKERPVTLKLSFWDRFQRADGFLATSLRLASAGGILFSLLWLSADAGTAEVTVHNGFGVPVRVLIDRQSVVVPALNHVNLDLARLDEHRFRAFIANDEVIDDVQVGADELGAHTLYNIAGGSNLVVVTASYGNASEREPVFLGNPQISTVQVDFLFSEPPEQISSKSGGGTRTALQTLDQAQVSFQLENTPAAGRDALIRAHVLLEPDDSERLQLSLSEAAQRPAAVDLIRARLAHDSENVAALRLLQEVGTESEREKACAAQTAMAAEAPENGNLLYLAIRCQPDGRAQNEQFLQASQRFPENGWLAFAGAHGLAEHGNWQAALDHFRAAIAHAPAIARDASLELLRLSALLDRLDQEPASSILRESPDLRAMWDARSGKVSEAYPWTMGLAALHRGDLEAALRHQQAQANSNLLALIAASDGADANMTQAGLLLNQDDSIGDTAVWAMYALAIREGESAESWQQRALEPLEPAHRQQVTAFLSHLEDPIRAETDLQELPAHLRASAYLHARVRLGASCPQAWQQMAERYLLASELPHFST